MEYLLLIIEFFFLKGLKSLIWYVIVPILIGFAIFYCSDIDNYMINASAFLSNVVTVLGILIGFTISTFTLLITVNTPNVELAKRKMIGKKIFSKDISLFDSVVTSLAYIILVQGALLIVNFIYPVFIQMTGETGRIMFAINISFLNHVILILMRSILDFYFILTKE